MKIRLYAILAFILACAAASIVALIAAAAQLPVNVCASATFIVSFIVALLFMTMASSGDETDEI